MAFNLKNSFTGGNIRLSNGQSYGNNIRDRLEIGQETTGASGNGSSSYKKVKPTGGSEPKKYPMYFLFGNQEITFYTPYNIWMSEEKFQQMQQKREYAKQFLDPKIRKCNIIYVRTM